MDATAREGYVRRSLSGLDLLVADRHLALCDACREALARDAGLQQAFHAVREELPGVALSPTAHLAYEQLESYVDGRLRAGNRAVIDQHLSSCARCNERLAGLQALREQLVPIRDAAPAATWWQRLSLLWANPEAPSSRSLRPAWTYAGATALVVLVALGLYQQQRIAGLSATVGEYSATLAENDRLRRDLEQREVALQELRTAETDRQKQIVSLKQRVAATTKERDRLVAAGATRPGPADEIPARYVLAPRSREISELLERDNLMSGGPDEKVFRLKNPVATVVESDRPTFQWEKVEGATEYRIDVSLGKETSVMVAVATVRGTQWKPARPFARGRNYSWQVIPIRDGQELPDVVSSPTRAAFRVLDAKRAAALARERAKTAPSMLRLAVQYANAGAYDRAEEIVKTVLRSDPNLPAARRLLADIEKLRERH